MSPFTSDCSNKQQHSIAAASVALMEAIETAAAADNDAGAAEGDGETASTASSPTAGVAVAVGAAAGGGGAGASQLGRMGGGAGAGTGARAANIMSYQNMIVLLTLLVCGLATVNGLKCHMCGQYNEGVGSITPCLNYSDQYAHLYLKECSKKSEKYCVKYVSELSIVRDCATECVEKEVWETKTFCCNTDGCNGSSNLKASQPLLLLPLLYYAFTTMLTAYNARH